MPSAYGLCSESALGDDVVNLRAAACQHSLSPQRPSVGFLCCWVSTAAGRGVRPTLPRPSVTLKGSFQLLCCKIEAPVLRVLL